MRINNIQGYNFQAQRRFVKPDACKNMKKILTNMDDDSIVISNSKAYMLKSVSLEGDTTLYANRKSLSEPNNIALLTLNKKAELIIDTDTGEIIDSNKSFFYTWNNILDKVSDRVKKIAQNFDNEMVVRRKYSTVDNSSAGN